jgi:glycosyltransferase involved in cell wall biosynthesis
VNILHVTPLYAPAWQFGGVVRSVSTLAETCAAKGARVSVVTTGIGTPHERHKKPHAELRHGVQVTYCPAIRSPIGIVSRALTQAVEAALPATDMCHITGVWQPSVLAAARLCRNKGVPYVTSPRGALSPYSFRDGWLKKRIYYALYERAVQRCAAAVHATSPLEEGELKALLPRSRVHVIPNICDATRWFPDRARALEWRRAHGIEPEAAVFLHVGRVEPKKNLPFLGEVARRLPATADWRFVLLGPAEATELDRINASFRGVSDRLVTIPGTGSEGELRGAYTAATCLVMPSFHENFGNVVLESLFCGTPFLASDQVGVAEMLAGFAYGSALPLSAEGWANSLAHMLPTSYSSRVSLAASDMVRSKFSRLAVADSMLDLYAAVVAAVPS